MKSALFLTPRLPYPPEDGLSIASWNLARCLRHNGYEIDLACFVGSPDAAAEHRADLEPVFRSITTATRDVSRQYPLALARALLAGGSYFVRKFRVRALERQLEERLRSGDYDLTVVDSAFTAVYLPVVRRFPSAGHVMVRLHNVEHEILERLARDERRPATRWLLRREARAFREFELGVVRADVDVRAISARDAGILSDLAERPVGVLEALIDADRYPPADPQDVESLSIVTIGDYAWMPNRNGVHWFHQRVWPGVRERFPDARWYVVGRNPSAAIRSLAGDGIEVTGRVDDDVAWFRRAHLLAVPLHEGSGVRIKILLALAMGKRVLSTRIGAEGIGYSGLELHDDEDDWIAAIVRAFERRLEVDREAVEYARRRHHWQRPLHLDTP